VIDIVAGIANAVVAAVIVYGASTGYADAHALKPVCGHEEDALEVVKGQLNHNPVWAEKVQEGKCAYVPPAGRPISHHFGGWMNLRRSSRKRLCS
jgi:hypothetical protein